MIHPLTLSCDFGKPCTILDRVVPYLRGIGFDPMIALANGILAEIKQAEALNVPAWFGLWLP